jgi:hypothetical protein
MLALVSDARVLVPTLPKFEEMLRDPLDVLGPAPRAELLPLLPDFE